MRYGVIYADPPWRFRTYSAKGTGRGAISHYDVMTVDELESMPVAEWALPDCVLLLWVPGPHTLQGLELMAAWGFSFKGTGFVWIKTNRTRPGYAMGTGYGTRKNAEICWQVTRGSPRRLSASVRELVVEPAPVTQPKARLCSYLYRAALSRTVSGIVCAFDVTGLGLPWRPGWLARSWASQNAAAAVVAGGCILTPAGSSGCRARRATR